MRSYWFLFLNYFAVLIECISINGRRVNLNLETVLEFNKNEAQNDAKMLDGVIKFAEKLKNILNRKPNRRSGNGDIDGYKFTDFLEHGIIILRSYSDKHLEDVIYAINDEMRKFHYRGCKFHELLENYSLRKQLSRKLEDLKHLKAPKVKKMLNESLVYLRAHKKSKEKTGILDFLNGLYSAQGSTRDMTNIIEQLKLYKSSSMRPGTEVSLSKIIQNAIRTLVFDQYSKLNTNARRDVKNILDNYWSTYFNETREIEVVTQESNNHLYDSDNKETASTQSKLDSQYVIDVTKPTETSNEPTKKLKSEPKNSLLSKADMDQIKKERKRTHVTLYPGKIRARPPAIKPSQALRSHRHSKHAVKETTESGNMMTLWVEERAPTKKQMWDDDYEDSDENDHKQIETEEVKEKGKKKLDEQIETKEVKGKGKKKLDKRMKKVEKKHKKMKSADEDQDGSTEGESIESEKSASALESAASAVSFSSQDSALRTHRKKPHKKQYSFEKKAQKKKKAHKKKHKRKRESDKSSSYSKSTEKYKKKHKKDTIKKHKKSKKNKSHKKTKTRQGDADSNRKKSKVQKAGNTHDIFTTHKIVKKHKTSKVKASKLVEKLKKTTEKHASKVLSMEKETTSKSSKVTKKSKESTYEDSESDNESESNSQEINGRNGRIDNKPNKTDVSIETETEKSKNDIKASNTKVHSEKDAYPKLDTKISNNESKVKKNMTTNKLQIKSDKIFKNENFNKATGNKTKVRYELQYRKLLKSSVERKQEKKRTGKRSQSERKYIERYEEHEGLPLESPNYRKVIQNDSFPNDEKEPSLEPEVSQPKTKESRRFKIVSGSTKKSESNNISTPNIITNITDLETTAKRLVKAETTKPYDMVKEVSTSTTLKSTVVEPHKQINVNTKPQATRALVESDELMGKPYLRLTQSNETFNDVISNDINITNGDIGDKNKNYTYDSVEEIEEPFNVYDQLNPIQKHFFKTSTTVSSTSSSIMNIVETERPITKDKQDSSKIKIDAVPHKNITKDTATNVTNMETKVKDIQYKTTTESNKSNLKSVTFKISTTISSTSTIISDTVKTKNPAAKDKKDNLTTKITAETGTNTSKDNPKNLTNTITKDNQIEETSENSDSNQKSTKENQIAETSKNDESNQKSTKENQIKETSVINKSNPKSVTLQTSVTDMLLKDPNATYSIPLSIGLRRLNKSDTLKKMVVQVKGIKEPSQDLKEEYEEAKGADPFDDLPAG